MTVALAPTPVPGFKGKQFDLAGELQAGTGVFVITIGLLGIDGVPIAGLVVFLLPNMRTCVSLSSELIVILNQFIFL